MQINGYGSMSEYYTELARQRARLNAASAAPEAPQASQTTSAGAAGSVSGDFASIFAEQTAAAEGAEANRQASPTAAADMLRFLAGSSPASASAPVEGAASAMAGNAYPARGSIFNEMLKSFGGTGSGGGLAYLQNMVRGAYGV